MMDDDPQVQDLIDRQGWEIMRREGRELILKVCPLCAKAKPGR